MRIIIDIAHPAHVNFFKHALRILRREGHEIIITGLRRGKLPRILEEELGDFPVHYVGRHRGTTFSILFEANVLKAFRLLWLVFRKRPDFGLSVGSFTLGGVLTLFGKPNVQFDDDPERSANVWLEKLTSTRLFFPPLLAPHKNVATMHALKEWAYLSPQYFKPDVRVLSDYGLAPQWYFFVREVSTGSLNYHHQEANTIASFADQLPADYPVLLSLEDKENRELYPKHWTLLREPVGAIHSLLYYSCLVISSGDSMAREGAMLGVPSVYVGVRDMKANALMREEKVLFQCPAAEASALVRRITDKTIPLPSQDDFRTYLSCKWDNITQLIVEQAVRCNPEPVTNTV